MKSVLSYAAPLVILVMSTTAVSAQGKETVVELRLTTANITTGKKGCDVSKRPIDTKGKSDPGRDTLIVAIFEDDTWKKEAEAPAGLRVFRENAAVHTIAEKTKRDVQSLEGNELADRTVSVRRFDSDQDLCIENVNPLPKSLARTAPRTTAFIADGAVSTALRTGNSNGSATGSLGIDHFDVKSANQQRHFLGWKRLPLLTAERFRALITVASSVDTLKDSTQTVFRHALLAPALASKGALGSAVIDYHPTIKLFDGSQGPRFNLTFARTTWRVTNRDSLVKGVRRDTAFVDNLTIGSFDARWRWSFIEQIRDADGNDFAVSLEAGYTMRWLGGDGASDKTFKTAALGTTQTVFHGAAGALIIRLRQITAIADVPYLWSKAPDLKGIKGLQPLLTINFEAPLFVFGRNADGSQASRVP